ncbi:type-2 ice-structuring protein-like [Saccostrea cucullata]|uniref:type-2 ice-structuring protein-like n=1 Tax=Saccostrea cuccullata TaxID=36930 RepID=UPI002ED043F2
MCRKRADSVSFFYNFGIKKCMCTGQVQHSDLLPFVGYVHFSSSELSIWKVFGKSHYLHIKKQIKWLDAQIECQELGAKLAEIETLEENIFLKSIARENNYGNTFIGGTDAFSQNRWRWSTTFQPVNFSDWAPSKPDTSGGDECMGLSANFDMLWDDMDCDANQASFMCERLIV